MINLIRNELTKLLKKKSIYIMIVLVLAIIVISNFMYKSNNETEYPIENQIEMYEKHLEELSPDKASDIASYIEVKTRIDTIKLIQKYGQSSWQATIITQKAEPYVREMNTYRYESEKNEQLLKGVEEKYQDLMKRLEENDWKYFAKEEQIEVEMNLQKEIEKKAQTVDKLELKAIENNIYNLELQKQVLNWRLEKDISYAAGYYNQTLEEYDSSQRSVRQYEQTDNHDYSEKQRYYTNLKTANESKYAIENNQEITKQTDARGCLLSVFQQFEMFIIIIVVMIAGAIVSEEFNKGTVKLLLVKPYSRTKILLAKFITCIIVMLATMALIVGMQFIVGGIIHGFDSLKIPAVVYHVSTSQIEIMSIFKYLGIYALAKLPLYILITTIAFAISTIFTNTALAIVISLLGYMSGTLITEMAQSYGIELMKFFITPNWDLSQYLFGNIPQFQHTNLGLSIVMCIAYFAIMMIPAIIVFKKKNIKNI